MTNVRFSFLDVCKCFGIFFVVLGHVSRGLQNSGLITNINIFSYVDSIIYSFHMPLFFFVSGLLFMSSVKGKSKDIFILKKLDVIVYPYILWSILQGSVEVILSSQTNGSLSFLDVFQLWIPRAQFWFLYVIFIVFLLSLIFMAMLKDFFVFFILIFSLILYIYSERFEDYNILKLLAYNFVFFSIACAIPIRQLHKFCCSKFVFFGSFFVAIFLQYYFHFTLSLNYTDRGFLCLFVSLSMILFIFSFSVMIENYNTFFVKTCVLVGQSSLFIYLTHILVTSGFRIVLVKIFGINDLSFHIFFGTLLGLILPFYFYQLIKDNKFKLLFTFPISKLLNSKLNSRIL